MLLVAVGRCWSQAPPVQAQVQAQVRVQMRVQLQELLWSQTHAQTLNLEPVEGGWGLGFGNWELEIEN